VPAVEPCLSFDAAPTTLTAVHELFARRIGAALVEDAASFVLTATAANRDWIPRLAIATVAGDLAGAQLGGLLPRVGMLSLPYTAVEPGHEGRGVYRALKQSMLDELARLARSLGLPPPTANVSEEAIGSEQYRRKVLRGTAVHLPFAYAQPAVQGLREYPLALTVEPLVTPAPALGPHEWVRVVEALYRGPYRIDAPWRDPTFRRIIAGINP
jgi:hypothetical protein